MHDKSRLQCLMSVLVAFALAAWAVIPAAHPVAAAGASLKSSQTYVAGGDTIAVTGYGFHAGDTVVVSADFSVSGNPRRSQAAAQVNTGGAFSAPLSVPQGAAPGVYAVHGRDFHGAAASTVIRVLPVLSMRVGSREQGVSVLGGLQYFVLGAGFAPGEKVALTGSYPLYSGAYYPLQTTVTADKNGGFRVMLQVPDGARAGGVRISAKGQSSKKTITGVVSVFYHPAVALTSAASRPGATITVQGDGFVANSAVRVDLALPRNGAPAQASPARRTSALSQTVNADRIGRISASFSLPANARPGSDAVSATDLTGGFKAFTTLLVSIKPTISLSQSSIMPGGSIQIRGSGYSANVPVTVGAGFPLYGGGSRTVSTAVKTDAAGNFVTTISAPSNAAAGSVTLVAQGPNGRSTAGIVIRRLATSLSVAPSSVAPGSATTVRGSGFLGQSRVDVAVTVSLVNGAKQTLTGQAVTNAQGQFVTTLRIPGSAVGGAYTVVARGAASGRAASAPLAIARLAPSIVASPVPGVPGTQLTVNGFGFAAGQSIAIYLQSQKIGTATTNSAGQFSTRITVPAGSATATYMLTAQSGGGRKASVSLPVQRQVSTHFYFASIYTGSGYSERIAFLNPSAIPARVQITYQLTSGASRARTIAIPAHTRFTEDVNADLGPHVSAGASISADVPLVAERIVGHGTDISGGPAATHPSTVWYFANGNTGHHYREFLAIQNPNQGPVQVAVHFLPTHHRAFTIYRTMPATSRTTVKVNTYVRRDAVGVIVTATGPVVVNRSIFIRHGVTSKIGVMAPQNTWYFASGPAGGIARYWIGAINPSNQRAYLTLHAYGPAGAELGSIHKWLRPFARVGFLINRVAGSSDAAVVLSASRGIVAEQTTYVGAMHNASTDTFGVSAPAKSWGFAAVNTLLAQRGSDVLTMFNPSVTTIPVVVQFMTSSGQVTQRTYLVPPLAHQRVDVDSVVPNARLGIVVSSDYPFVAMNRIYTGNRLGSLTSMGIPL